MAFSFALEKKLPWHASCPTRNSRTIAIVTVAEPSSLAQMLSTIRTSSVPAANNRMSSSSTRVGRKI